MIKGFNKTLRTLNTVTLLVIYDLDQLHQMSSLKKILLEAPMPSSSVMSTDLLNLSESYHLTKHIITYNITYSLGRDNLFKLSQFRS